MTKTGNACDSHPMTTFLVRHCTRALGSLVALAFAGTLTACDIDSPLGATGDQRAVSPGERVTGQVQNPDGDITVTLASAATVHPKSGTNSAEATGCDYDDGDYSCATEGLAQGAYRVEVTDAKYPGEGTHYVDVVITDVEGYDPSVVLGDDHETVELAGWAPGREVTLTVTEVTRLNRAVRPISGTPDDNGSLSFRIVKLDPGTYALEATDGLWSTGDPQGWERALVTV